jgi:hypothetical protein
VEKSRPLPANENREFGGPTPGKPLTGGNIQKA